MPTDPFVNPDLDDRPRQQQNLPPGVAYPPARHWVPDRPGDTTLGQPRGPQLGDPGPNVGYAYTLAQRAKKRLRLAPGEQTDDAIAALAEIAGRRAASFGRAPVMADVDHAIALLGYEESDKDWSAMRARIVHGAGHHYQHRREIVGSVPEATLRARTLERNDVEAWRRTAADLVAAH